MQVPTRRERSSPVNGPGRGHDEEGRRQMDDRSLRDEVRQSLSLIAMTALTLLASIAFGLLVGHVG